VLLRLVSAVRRLRVGLLPLGIAAPASLLATVAAAAGPSFEEVSGPAGISGGGESFGAAWGDLDGDGWPDLWVSNHAKRPSLYRNQRDGTFRDVLDEAWSGDPAADTHAAAWADSDGDGDEDLVELVGAVITADEFCLGCADNHFYANEGGTLRERAAQVGLDGLTGLARTPLWLDLDRDGALDLLVVNQRGARQPSSVLYRQTGGRFQRFHAAGFSDAAPTRLDKGIAILRNLAAMRLWRPDFQTDASRAFAQLADLSGDDVPDLVYHGVPTRVFSTLSLPLTEITSELGFPPVGRTSDAAIEDFDGDGKMDLYLTRGPYTASVVQPASPEELRLRLGWSRQGPTTGPGIAFRSDGPIEVRLHYPYWFEPEKIFLGSEGGHPESLGFSLDPSDPAIASAPDSPTVSGRGGVQIGYDPANDIWVLRNGSRLSMELSVHTSGPVSDLRRLDFAPFRERGVDVLLRWTAEGFVEKPLVGAAGAPTACHAVSAGDFDNDMDVDLYLVCSGPIQNLPNRLLLNDGHGNFSAVESDFGARGSERGRGDVAVTADYDRDGFLDLFVTNGSDPGSPFVADGPHQLFHNRGNANHWLEVDLEGVESNAEGIGAVLWLEAGGVVQRREQDGGMHVFSQDHTRVHFGLGPNERAERLSVRWPNGRVQQLEDLPADQIWVVREGAGAAAQVDAANPRTDPMGSSARTD
jgi:hypothetical protein